MLHNSHQSRSLDSKIKLSQTKFKHQMDPVVKKDGSSDSKAVRRSIGEIFYLILAKQKMEVSEWEKILN